MCAACNYCHPCSGGQEENETEAFQCGGPDHSDTQNDLLFPKVTPPGGPDPLGAVIISRMASAVSNGSAVCRKYVDKRPYVVRIHQHLGSFLPARSSVPAKRQMCRTLQKSCDVNIYKPLECRNFRVYLQEATPFFHPIKPMKWIGSTKLFCARHIERYRLVRR